MLRRARPQLRFARRVPVRVLGALALGAAAALIPGLSSLASAVVASAVYFAALLALGAIPQELVDAALHRARRVP